MRPPSEADLASLVEIAVEGGSPDADPAYLRFVAGHGRLLVVDVDGAVAGFAGAIPIGGATMITDLFVARRCRGRGLGAALLAAVVAGAAARMTFSSQDPAAQAAYRRLGVLPRWDLLTLRREDGGDGRTPFVPVAAGGWVHERGDLVEYFRSRGAQVGDDHVVLVEPDRTVVLRAVGERWEAVIERLLAELPSDRPVELSVPEPHPAAPWLRARGFHEVDRDVFFADATVAVPRSWSLVHRGLF